MTGRSSWTRGRGLSAVFWGLILCGCTVVNPVVPETGQYYISPDADFSRIGRVVVFEFENQTEYPFSSTDLTQAVTDGLQRKNLFNLRIIPRDSDLWQDMQLDKSSFTNQELLDIRKRLSADAVLLGRVKGYQPYPHLMSSLHLKLIDLNTGGIFWGLEQIWDSTDQSVQRRMKMYYRDKMGDIYDPLNWQVLITSPREFHKFVADEVAQTLPHAAQILNMRPSVR
ncbi:MAG: hypothetical protein GX455_02845 [Phycisphaerae bacterium]|nr:hypothetical protein [Phycisphaerae bacterium]